MGNAEWDDEEELIRVLVKCRRCKRVDSVCFVFCWGFVLLQCILGFSLLWVLWCCRCELFVVVFWILMFSLSLSRSLAVDAVKNVLCTPTHFSEMLFAGYRVFLLWIY
jgi:hypothetical protein